MHSRARIFTELTSHQQATTTAVISVFTFMYIAKLCYGIKHERSNVIIVGYTAKSSKRCIIIEARKTTLRCPYHQDPHIGPICNKLLARHIKHSE